MNDREYFQHDFSVRRRHDPHVRYPMEVMGDRFLFSIISLPGGDLNWPARFTDLIPRDYFLWNYLEDKVFLTSLEDPERINFCHKRWNHNPD